MIKCISIFCLLQSQLTAGDLTSHSSMSSNSDVEVDFSEVELGPRIGLGCFGEVFKARWRQTTIAVKRLYDQSLSQESLKVSRLLCLLHSSCNVPLINSRIDPRRLMPHICEP